MKVRSKRKPQAVTASVSASSSIDLRLGDWRAVLADLEVDAVVTDPPFGKRVHEFAVQRMDGCATQGLMPGYEHWTRDHVFEFVRSWSPRTRGWMVAITSHDLVPAFEDAFADVDRYAFPPVGALVYGMGVRMLGDGPSSWMLHIVVARPKTKAMMEWGTLPGGYHGPASRESGGGRGKPDWLMQALVRDYTRRGDLVAEPFCGWGSTFEACLALDRRCVGSEVNPSAYAEARRRLARGVQTDMFAGCSPAEGVGRP